MNNKETATETVSSPVITAEALLEHWQGHRKLTRRLIEAFPEDKLFTYSLAGMRPFAELVLEFFGMTIPGIRGVVTGTWQKVEEMAHRSKLPAATTKKELLDQWDETTEQLNELWAQIPPERFQEQDKAFGQWRTYLLLHPILD